MIASMPTAVLPVLRSPMISSRWPRPIGVIASMALMPVCSGSLTGCTLGDARGDDFDRAAILGDDRAFAVERIAERIDHAAEQLVADGHAQQAAGAADFVAFGDLQVVAEDDDADGVLFEVERQADRAVGELDHLLGHDAREAVDAGDAVADFEHAADFADVDLRGELLDFLLNDRGDFVAIEFHRSPNTCMSLDQLAETKSVRLRFNLIGRPVDHRSSGDFEMGVQRTIEHTIADANDNAGDQVGVDGHVATWLHADRFFHPRFDNLADIIIQLRWRREFRHRPCRSAQ